jgi:pyruvate formate lyase activating enzyme
LIEHPEKFQTVLLSSLDHHLRANHDFLDGVCITGGEPTLYNGLTQFIEHIKELDLKIKLDTNGTNPELIFELIENNKIDYIAMDLKGPVDERYNEMSGIKTDLKKIKKSIQIIMNSSIDYEFRTTVVPKLIGENEIIEMSNYVSGAEKYVLQQFIPGHARKEELRLVKPYDNKTMKTLQKLAKKNIENVFLRSMK